MGRINLREAFAAGWRIFVEQLAAVRAAFSAGWRVYRDHFRTLIGAQAILIAIWLVFDVVRLTYIWVIFGFVANSMVLTAYGAAIVLFVTFSVPLATGMAFLVRDCVEDRPATAATVFRGFSMWRKARFDWIVAGLGWLDLTLQWLPIFAGFAVAGAVYPLMAENKKAFQKANRAVIGPFTVLAAAMSVIVNADLGATAPIRYSLPVGVTKFFIAPRAAHFIHLIWLIFAAPFCMCVMWAAYRRQFPRPAIELPPPLVPDGGPVRWPLWTAATALVFAVVGLAAVWMQKPTVRAFSANNQESLTIGYKFVTVPAGRFQMGQPSDERERWDRATPHPVTISKAYLLGATEVTQAQWKAVMDGNPSNSKECGEDCPVTNVSWTEAVNFCNRLSDIEGLSRCYRDGGLAERVRYIWAVYVNTLEECAENADQNAASWKSRCTGSLEERVVSLAYPEENVAWNRGCTGYRLPTEAEWEYAARAGGPLYASGPVAAAGEKCKADVDSHEIHQYRVPAGYHTHSVTREPANAWGLSGMTGTQWEWVWDRNGEFLSGAATDPTGRTGGSGRVIRTANWYGKEGHCRFLARLGFSVDVNHDNLTFRIARSLP